MTTGLKCCILRDLGYSLDFLESCSADQIDELYNTEVSE
jgi:hypothetical protein